MKTEFSIPITLNTTNFVQAWESWILERRERRRPLTNRAAELQLRTLELIGPERAVAAIEHSIMSGYTGVFEPPQRRSPTYPESKPTAFTLTKQIEAIDKEMVQLRNTGGREDAFGFGWVDQKKRDEFVKLKARRKELSSKLIQL